MANDAAQTGNEDVADLWNEMQAEDDRQAKAADAIDKVADGAAKDDDEPFEGEIEADGATASSASTDTGSDNGVADDIWKDAPAPLREAYLAEKTRNDQLEHRARSDSNRVSALQRKIASLQAATAEPAQAPKIAEQLDALNAEYPEVAEPLTKAFSSVEERLNKDEEGRRKAAQTELAAAQDEFNQLTNRAHSFAEKQHPGWQQFIGERQEEFGRWALDQPLAMREKIARNGEHSIDGAEIVDIVSGFKAHIGGSPGPAGNPANPTGGISPPLPANATSDRRRRQLDGSAGPGRGGGRAALTGLPNDAPEKDLWDEMERQGLAT